LFEEHYGFVLRPVTTLFVC